MLRPVTVCSMLVLGAAVAGCSAAQYRADAASTLQRTSEPLSFLQERPALFGRGKIQHVVIVVQENRSFDDLFYGFPGANTATSGLNSQGQRVALQPIGLQARYEIRHFVQEFLDACDGGPSGQNCKMDGFDKEQTYGTSIPPNPQYGYVPHRETKPYFDIAKQYVLADDMFASNIDSSFVSHQYIIAGQAGDAVNIPDFRWGCGGGRRNVVATLNVDRTVGPAERPCFNYATLGDELAAKGLSWRYYAVGENNLNFGYSAYQAIKHIYAGPQWKANVVSPPARFLSDVASGQLSAVTWVTPTGRNSDHPDPNRRAKHGPEWVASVVNAVGQSQFWNSTAIFIMWDEWGGWYDHVPPPYVDFDGLGFRVPLMVVSPYAKHGYVSHVQYEHGSILRFIEDLFGVPRLAATDRRANSPAADCFDFRRPPRPFQPIPTRLSARDFITAPDDTSPIDDE